MTMRAGGAKLGAVVEDISRGGDIGGVRGVR